MISSKSRWAPSRASALVFGLLAGTSIVAEAALPPIAPGQWYEVPNSRMSAVAPSPLPGGEFKNIVDAWNGGAFDSKRNQLLVWGGGHGDYAGNEVYGFDLDDLRWRRLSAPSVADNASTPNYPDGQPRARHTYNYIDYVASIDRLVSFGGSAPWPKGGGEFTREIAEFDIDAGRWTTGQRASVPSTGTMVSANARYDSATGDVFFVGGMSGSLRRYSTANNQWSVASETIYVSDIATAAIDPVRRIMVAVGYDASWGGPQRQILRWDLDRKGTPVNLASVTTGDTTLEGVNAPGFTYHPKTQKFVGWAGGTDVFVLDPANWRWTRVAAAAGSVANPGMPPKQGTFGRFQYVPSLDLFVLVNGTEQNVFLYRPGWSSTQAGPVIDLKAGDLSVAKGASVTLNWTVSAAASCTASGGWSGDKALKGTEIVGPVTDTTVYRLECVDGAGQRAASQVAVGVAATAPAAGGVSVQLAADRPSLTAGQYAVLNWSSAGASSCAASGAWSGTRAVAGSETVGPVQSDVRYQIQCSGASGSASTAVDIRVVAGPQVVMTSTPAEVPLGGTARISWRAEGAAVCGATGDWSGAKGPEGAEEWGPILKASVFELECTGATGVTQAKVSVALASRQKTESSGAFGIGGFDGIAALVLLTLAAVRRESSSLAA